MSEPDNPFRLAIIGINYAPEEIGIGRYTADMARAIAARGSVVEVIAAKPYYPQWSVPAEWRGGWRRDLERGVHVTRCPIFVPAHPNGIKRILHLASFAVSSAAPALGIVFRARKRRPQVVLCVVPALLSVPVAWLVARLTGARLWIHVQDFEVEAALATGLVSNRGGLGAFARAVENRLLRLADRVSTISPQMCASLRAKGIPGEAVIEVRNWADDTVRPDPSAGAGYRRDWHLADAHVALYSGNIANKQGIEIVIEAARELAHRKDIAWVFCGEGPNRARLEAMAEGLENIQFHDLQPASRMTELLGLASVHLLPQIPGAADLVLPSKLTNMLASARPIVATAEPGTGLHEEVEGCGINVRPGDPKALAAAVSALVDDPARRALLGAEARVRSLDRWSIDRIIDRLSAELQKVAGG